MATAFACDLDVGDVDDEGTAFAVDNDDEDDAADNNSFGIFDCMPLVDATGVIVIAFLLLVIILNDSLVINWAFNDPI